MEESPKQPKPSTGVVDEVALSGSGTEEITMNDDFFLEQMGYNPQMKREFSPFQLICSAFTVTNSWLGVASGFTSGISAAGPASITYGLILMFILNIFVAISLSELISAMPTSGGQYYWALTLAPKKVSRVAAYITGVCNLFAAYCITASSTIAVSQFVFGCIKLACPSVDISEWRIYLLAVAMNLIGAILNLWTKAVATSVIVGLWVSLLTCIALTIVIPVRSHAHTDATFIFATLENSSGWASDGIAFVVGLINANFPFAFLDSAAHLAEETPNPARNVPRAIICTVCIGFCTAFPFACVILYSMTEYDRVLNTPTRIPLIELLNVSFQSQNAAITAVSFITLAYIFSLFPQQAYQSRMCWAFARDNGMPFSRIWSQVHPKTNVPLNAHILSVCIVIVLTLIYIASSTAFASLITGVIVFPYLTYLIPIASSIWRGKNQPKGPFHLGVLGVIAKIITLVFCLFTIIMYSFPFIMPATATNMNYISVLYVIAFVYGVLDWVFRARHSFRHSGNPVVTREHEQ
ncbi:unnamed protein product [Clonostachys rhizophaga]|uniref:Choline transport protein n=1 Tax=Clonostachys rhizophaga TaxID=160324 RepID=A0A9N9YIJ9_9HYPO|nr:unnamed protein product [Clonostachys rhizophaga]